MFDVSALRELQREAAAVAYRLTVAASAAEADHTGADGSGAVRVTIGANGNSVLVRLDSDWKGRAGVHGLGRAVVEAVNAATAARTAAWAAAMPPADDRPTPEVADVQGPELGDPSSAGVVAAVRDAFRLAAEVGDRLAEMAAAADTAAPADVVSTDPMGTVRVTQTAGVVTAVDIDERWLRSAGHDRIAAALRDALRASLHQGAGCGREALDAVPGLDRVRALTASPQSLLTEIGFLR